MADQEPYTISAESDVALSPEDIKEALCKHAFTIFIVNSIELGHLPNEPTRAELDAFVQGHVDSLWADYEVHKLTQEAQPEEATVVE